MALVKVTLNNSSRVEDQLNETELIACLRDALKRKLKSFLHLPESKTLFNFLRCRLEGETQLK